MKRFVLMLTFVVIAALLSCGACAVKRLSFINDSIIEKTVEGLAHSLKAQKLYTGRYGILWDSGMCARQAVWREKFGDEWRDKMYGSLAIVEGRGIEYYRAQGHTTEPAEYHAYIMERARETLRFPNVLKASYYLYKGKALTEVKKQGIESELKKELEKIIPFFEGRVAEEKKALLKRRVAQSKAGISTEELDREITKEHFDRGEYTFFEIYTFEWVERRRAEGGDELVAAYAEVIQDAIDSL